MASRKVKRMDGIWGFLPDPEGKGEKEGWHLHGLPGPHAVKVPHTWNVTEGLEEYRGIGWYEYRFSVPVEWAGLSIRIQFDAVYRDASVWLNGRPAGTHSHSGYTAFVLDVTSAVRWGSENILVVSVDNRHSGKALPIRNSFDWADDGGMIRGASMIVTGQPCIDWVKIGAVPLFADDPAVQASGSVELDICFCEELPSGPVFLKLDIRIGYGDRTVWSGTRPLPAGSMRTLVNDIRLEDVELWHFDHPHLYQLKVKVLHDGAATDEWEASFGFRELLTVGQQLWLNREPVRLMGVEWMPGSHPDIGMAESEEDMIRVLRQMKEANCVITRFHWQQDEKLLDWCDRNGILVQEEIPHWQQPEEPDESLMPISNQHAEEMILRHYNHPCIFAWGMGNELSGHSVQTVQYMQRLKAFIRTLDSRRMINYVSNTVHVEAYKDATGVGDILMWNDYIGTWQGEHDMASVIESIFAAYPDKPLIVAEYGLCEPAYAGGDPRRIGILREKTDIYRSYTGFAALIFFSLNDYRTQMGENGAGRMRQRIHGVTDFYGNIKPSYQELRDISSPVIVESVRRVSQNDVMITLKARDDIPSYTVSGYHLMVHPEGDPSAEAKIGIPSLAPGQTAALMVPEVAVHVNSIHLKVMRPTGFSVLDQAVDLDGTASSKSLFFQF